MLFIGLIALATMATGEPAPGPATEHYEMQGALLEAEGSVGQDLAAMDTAVTEGATMIGSVGLNGTGTKAALARMGRFPWTVDTITVNKSGFISMAEPEIYESVIGVHLGDQKHLQRLYSDKVPVMSDVILSVEGIPAVDIASPVFSPDGRFIGATTLLFRPEPFFTKTPQKSQMGPHGISW